MEEDSFKFATKCAHFQFHGDTIYVLTAKLYSLTILWTFHTQEFDLIGLINPSSNGYTWTLATTECFTKWVEVVPLKKVSEPTMANFIKQHVIVTLVS